MTRTLFDLAGADDRVRFSPYCWRIKMALSHKQLDFETVPWRFTEKATIAESGQGRVPVLKDGDVCVADSWRIAAYLDEAYPGGPALMAGEAGRAAARFVNAWADTALNGAIRPLALLAVVRLLGEEDAAYFRRSREEMLGRTLEEASGDPRAARDALSAALAPVELHLGDMAYLAGHEPAYADYIVYGSLQWLAVARGTPCLDTLPATAAWFERLGERFDGLGRDAPRTAHAAA